MSRRRASLIAAALAVAAGAAAALIVLHDRRPEASRGATGGTDPLAFVPARAPVVLDLDSKAPLVALAVEQLAPRLTGGRLSVDAVEPLLGGRVAVALDGPRAWLAFQTSAAAPPGTVARDGVVLSAPGAVAEHAALAQAGAPSAAYARDAFDKRFDGLPASAGARVAFDPHRLLADREPKLAATRWGRSLRDGVAVLTRERAGLRVPVRITAEPVGLTAADLPFATGPAAAPTTGSAALTVGLRDPGQTVAFAREAQLVSALDLLGSLPGIVRPNLDDLGPAATITSPDARTFTARTTPPDPGDWSRRLSALDTFSSIVGGVDVSDQDGTYTISQGGGLLARAGVFGPVLMLSEDPRADLRALAGGRAAPPPRGAAGALTIAAGPDLLKPLVPGIVRARLRVVTGWARAETTGITGELRIGLR